MAIIPPSTSREKDAKNTGKCNGTNPTGCLEVLAALRDLREAEAEAEAESDEEEGVCVTSKLSK